MQSQSRWTSWQHGSRFYYRDVRTFVIEKLGVKYRNYICDGDSKTYSSIINYKPYGDDFTINKKEFIGHVQTNNESLNRNLSGKLVQSQ